MTTTQKREWTEAAGNDMPELSQGKRLLWVEDGTLGHYTELGPLWFADSEMALADYTAGYDKGEHDGPIEATWHYWKDGKERSSGSFRF